ncbi:MAG: SLC13 family permease [Candidatus Paceibacterota bacterium]
MADIDFIVGYVPQLVVFVVLVALMLAFMRGRPRYDVVSLLALVAVVLAGLIAPEEAFLSFGHPAVIIVASMFIISQGLVLSGVIDIIGRKFIAISDRPLIQMFLLIVVVAFVSAFVSNIVALALFLPIVIRIARENNISPSKFLIPLAFASHLGGFLTLISTSRNIIVSSFRADQPGLEGFGMFDFALVGLPLAVIGITFLSLVGWRLLPNRRKGAPDKYDLFEVRNYTTEVKVAEGSDLVGTYVKDLPEKTGLSFSIHSLARSGWNIGRVSGLELLREGDVLVVSAEPNALTELTESADFELTQAKAKEGGITPEDEQGDIEAVITPHSPLVGKSWDDVPLRLRYGVNLLAVAREGTRLTMSLENTVFRASDILLLQGRKESIQDSISALGCYPLADRGLSFGRSRHIVMSLIIFVTAITLATLSLVPLHIAFIAAALAMILANIMSVKQAYESIDWSVLVLLGAMLAFSEVFETSGSARMIGDLLVDASDVMTPLLMLGIVLVATVLVSDFINSTAAAVLMAPIGIIVATGIGVSVDPFLMAVAIGSAAAFLTPFGHGSNTLVLGPGGYKFIDYVKVGLPMDIIVVVSSLVLLPIFWPF